METPEGGVMPAGVSQAREETDSFTPAAPVGLVSRGGSP